MIAKNCPHCGQPMPLRRLGVTLSQTKAEIFDAIHRSGYDGISWDSLWRKFRAEHPNVQRTTLKAHVHQLSDRLEDVGWKINGRSGVYRLMKA